ncbi:ROK family glucokinase [Bacillus smithii]|uniref:ROK family glucokinase n=1 Tax=Bacillus smithii TaxID=1479 RepID=UPI003D1D3192
MMAKEKWIAAVDLGGTSVKLAFLNMDGEILDHWSIPTDRSSKGRNIVPDIAKSIFETLHAKQETKDRLLGIGLGAPGPIDYSTGRIYKTVNLGWEDDYPLKQALEKETGLPVVVENDANCAALGEMWKGAGNGAANLVCVTLGTGVGGGVIANGDIVLGAKGAAGEIGHIVVEIEDGFSCNCGKKGCLETVASATGIVRLAKVELERADSGSILKEKFNANQDISAKDVFEAADGGDDLAKRIVDRVAFYLGFALANIGNSLNPDYIVVGGGVSNAGSTLLDPVRKYFKQYAFPPVGESTKIERASLGNSAGVIGAGWLVKKEFSREQ